MNCLRHDGSNLARELVKLDKKTVEKSCEIVVSPPYTLLSDIGDIIFGSSLKLGAQDSHVEKFGPFTGDISAEMLVDCGCNYVIIGHSERRLYHQETSKVIANKVIAAIEAGLRVILCVGETATERDSGQASRIVTNQVKEALAAETDSSNVVIAYEPIWAIGSGHVPSREQIRDMHLEIRRTLRIVNASKSEEFQLVYGGSVKGANAEEILSIENVNGALVGGASLSASEFWGICSYYD